MAVVDGVGVVVVVPVSRKLGGRPASGTSSAAVAVWCTAFDDVCRSCVDLEVHMSGNKQQVAGTSYPVDYIPVYLLVAV